MIDHDKLLVTMYDLGFPTDAIDVVKDLYTGATTSVKWDSGITKPIPIERGSIQGDIALSLPGLRGTPLEVAARRGKGL